MRLVKPSYEILAISNNLNLPYNYDSEPERLIELAGRICYKSEENITTESSIDFINKIKKRQHLSVFEHSWKYKFFKNTNLPKYKFLNYLDTAQGTLVAGNFRAFEEWEKEYIFNNSDLYEINKETIYELIYKHKRWDMLSASVKLVVNRGVCYSDDTWVLTENGFKHFSDIVTDEKIFTLTENNELVLSDYVQIIKERFVGKMHNFKTNQIDLLVTPNHNMWVYDVNKGEKLRQWKFLKASEMSNRAYKFNKSNNMFKGEKLEETVMLQGCQKQRGQHYIKQYPDLEVDTYSLFELLGLWITNGNLYISNNTKGGLGNNLSISQKKENVRSEIEILLRKLNINYTLYKNTYKIWCPQLYEFIKQQFIRSSIGTKTYYVSIPKWMKSVETKYLEALLKGILLGDGTKLQKGGYELYTASPKFALDLVEICLKLGKSANIRTNDRTNLGPNKYGIVSKVTMYIVSIAKRENYIHLYKKKKSENAHELIDYDGNVWCVELPENHRLFVMRNGKGVWCGNSHELVRHRPASYSQESTRYCNYSKDKFGGHITYIIPPWVNIEEGIYDSHIPNLEDQASRYWYTSLKIIELQYFELLKNGWRPQQARDILPNALKTEIVVTCNLQEWIHIFNLRALGTTGTPHPQMSEIMIPLYEDFKKLFPKVF